MSSFLSSSDHDAQACSPVAAPFERLAPFYDAIYAASGKDFRAEAASISALVREKNPNASTLLDVGCGTGAHLRWWLDEFECVGVDRSEAMLNVARRTAPSATLINADMETFRVNRRFDVVTCLFASLAYLPSPEVAGDAIRRMVDHLAPNGVLILEPGVLLEDLKPPAASVLELEADGTAVRRETSAVVSDQRLNIMFEFQLTHATGATDRFTELHSMLLLARDELERTLQSLGLCLEPARVSTTNQFRFKCTRA